MHQQKKGESPDLFTIVPRRGRKTKWMDLVVGKRWKEHSTGLEKNRSNKKGSISHNNNLLLLKLRKKEGGVALFMSSLWEGGRIKKKGKEGNSLLCVAKGKEGSCSKPYLVWGGGVDAGLLKKKGERNVGVYYLCLNNR